MKPLLRIIKLICIKQLLLLFSALTAAIPLSIWFFPENTLGPLGSLLVEDNKPEKADAIVVLAGGEAERIFKAAELYRQSYAPVLVFIEGHANEVTLKQAPAGFNWPQNGALYRDAFKSLGVPVSALLILPSPGAYDTAHELSVVAAYAKTQSWKSLILVTSADHSRRSDIIWRRVSNNMKHYTVSAPVPGFDSWWKQGSTRRIVAYEYGAMVKEAWAQICHIF